jgi:hypothetical protein
MRAIASRKTLGAPPVKLKAGAEVALDALPDLRLKDALNFEELKHFELQFA